MLVSTDNFGKKKNFEPSSGLSRFFIGNRKLVFKVGLGDSPFAFLNIGSDRSTTPDKLSSQVIFLFTLLYYPACFDRRHSNRKRLFY